MNMINLQNSALFPALLYSLWYDVTVNGVCTPFKTKPLSQFLSTGQSCNLYQGATDDLASCGQLCFTINKCLYFTDDSSDCYLCIDTPLIDKANGVTLTSATVSFAGSKEIYQKKDTTELCTPACVNGNCVLVEKAWICDCNTNYIWNDCSATSFSGYTFTLYDKLLNRYEAMDSCKNKGQELLSIYNSDFVGDLQTQGLFQCTSRDYIWTSGYKARLGFTWIWDNKKKITTPPWDFLQPGLLDACVTIKKTSKKLHSYGCYSHACYVCQKLN